MLVRKAIGYKQDKPTVVSRQERVDEHDLKVQDLHEKGQYPSSSPTKPKFGQNPESLKTNV
eukprot:3625232-Prorocentrum_lima.AAC.1